MPELPGRTAELAVLLDAVQEYLFYNFGECVVDEQATQPLRGKVLTLTTESGRVYHITIAQLSEPRGILFLGFC